MGLASRSRDFLWVFIFANIRSSASKHPCHAPVFLAMYPPGFWVLGLKVLWGSVFPDPLSLRSCPLGALPIIPLCLSREEAKKQKNKKINKQITPDLRLGSSSQTYRSLDILHGLFLPMVTKVLSVEEARILFLFQKFFFFPVFLFMSCFFLSFVFF